MGVGLATLWTDSREPGLSKGTSDSEVPLETLPVPPAVEEWNAVGHRLLVAATMAGSRGSLPAIRTTGTEMLTHFQRLDSDLRGLTHLPSRVVAMPIGRSQGGDDSSGGFRLLEDSMLVECLWCSLDAAIRVYAMTAEEGLPPEFVRFRATTLRLLVTDQEAIGGLVCSTAYPPTVTPNAQNADGGRAGHSVAIASP